MTELPEDERRDLEHRLTQARPVPSAAFRGALRRRLIGTEAGRVGRVRLAIAAYAGSGATLLLVALAGVLGLGPLAA